MKQLPSTKVRLAPKRFTLRATSGPGKPDMIMYTENISPKVSRGRPSDLAMAALMTAGP